MNKQALRVVSSIFAIVLVIGEYSHINFIQQYGWFAYARVEQVSELFNIYWTLLTIVNPIVIGILIFKPWLGIRVFTVHMAINVCMNGISLYIYTHGYLLHGPQQVIQQGIIFVAALVAWFVSTKQKPLA